MLRFIARRLAIALGLLLVLSVVIYALLDIAMDPLEDLRTSPALNRDELIAIRVAQLNLDLPWYQRYWMWLTNFVRGDFGMAWRTGQQFPWLFSAEAVRYFEEQKAAIRERVSINNPNTGVSPASGWLAEVAALRAPPRRAKRR